MYLVALVVAVSVLAVLIYGLYERWCAHEAWLDLIDDHLSNLGDQIEWLDQQTQLGRVEVLKGKLKKSTDDAAGWDIFSTETVTLFAGQSRVVKTGLVTSMHGVFGLIRDRSGLAAKYRVTTRAGVIDSKYPEEWGVVMVNEGPEAYQVKEGDRIAQVIFMPTYEILVEGDGVVVDTRERTGGFGSTDTNSAASACPITG